MGETEKRALKIIKCRSSRHSKFLHNYKIIRGLGLMIQQHPLEIKGTKDIPNKLKKVLKEKAKLRPREYDQFEKNLEYLIDDDFAGMDYSEVENLIIQELSD
jgi:hypothetical protein